MRALMATPARYLVVAYALAVAIGSILLELPIATQAPGSGPVVDAVFTSVSAVCITGLTSVDTGTHWTPFGQTVILGLVQVGGLGIVTLATLFTVALRGRLRMSDQKAAQADAHADEPGRVRHLVGRIVRLYLLIELVVMVLLFIRFRTTYEHDVAGALWQAFFHAISGVNNAGFSTHSDNLIRYVSDLWIIGVLSLATIIGGIGYPVIFELRKAWRTPSRWTLHTRLTLFGTAGLLALGFVMFLALEWANPATIGGHGWHEKVVAAIGGTAFPRTAGFNAVDYGLVRPETLVGTQALMFIGGGSAGTAGGIKITTFLILAAAMWAEIRGESDVVIAHRSINSSTLRQALTVALSGVALVMTGAVILMLSSDLSLDLASFEATSAFATVGLSANVTPTLDPVGKVVLMVLMFVGRVGPITFATSMAMRSRYRHRRYQLPHERPIIG
ncbi:TrkH family potassium uptake protein [Demetria terragena]|uniref:TrkH family potassium uptake protein n=1 Tax=Demetria terragena TaxID=63959 RepID=UPI00037F808C|nr:potassium transporter TrkG [Demetria terragena]